MNIAYVHILPIEYYPPATNTIRILASKQDVQLTVWTSKNLKNRQPFECRGVAIERPQFVVKTDNIFKRVAQSYTWHWYCARAIKRSKADAIISVEPHSALAVWFYYYLLGGRAKLFIHHHEYYAPVDYQRKGMRNVQLASKLEKKHLFPRALWISQTNENRLQFLQRDNPKLATAKLKVWPNYPPRSWHPESTATKKTKPVRMLFVGSASFRDTYIKEIVEWVARHPDDVTLMISGYNIEPAIWEWLNKMAYPNVATNPKGWSYDELPQQLGKYDVGLILYRGNTINFIYNAPNKLFEYWAAGLETWYPQEMKQISEFAERQPTPPLRKMDFSSLDDFQPPVLIPPEAKTTGSDYSCEAAIAPLLDQLSL
ncbi:hypothetical protein [Cerasicoccus arenae]|uniref:Glycosyltransferase n=1 Tax=Cerasicoccus arenae TaxID=424488 RepID=A0A8J3GCY9_9BACT|nr:hypothetical protein [Cerasicoccus arenae]MBK1857038.1 hypothetical protein [Cerasicoccus arenae]GHB92006.1 hypothetical protein GCM10007047_03720 [Cerasicoccus arenae]